MWFLTTLLTITWTLKFQKKNMSPFLICMFPYLFNDQKQIQFGQSLEFTFMGHLKNSTLKTIPIWERFESFFEIHHFCILSHLWERVWILEHFPNMIPLFYILAFLFGPFLFCNFFFTLTIGCTFTQVKVTTLFGFLFKEYTR